MLTKLINSVTLPIFCGMLGAFLYSQVFSKSIVYIDLDAVINRTKQNIIKTYGNDSHAIKSVATALGARIQDVLGELEEKHVVIAESAVLAGGKDYTDFVEKKIMKTLDHIKD